jgi:DNA-binding NarL/FixJ family response regulator
MPITRVLIIEDHPLFSKGLVSLITSQPLFMIAGEARNSAEAKELLKTKQTDLVILDLNLGDEDGLELIGDLKTLAPGIRVLVLSMHDERYYAERALKAGAQGYIMKAEAGNKVFDAIKAVMAGKVYLSAAEQERLFGSEIGQEKQAPVKELSERQVQIFTLIGKGLGTAEIAAQLELSPKTVDAHKEHIKQKLRCPSSQELRRMAVEWINR